MRGIRDFNSAEECSSLSQITLDGRSIFLFPYKRLGGVEMIFMHYLSYDAYHPIEIGEVVGVDVHSYVYPFAPDGVIPWHYRNRPSYV
jgi:hypothetical protein